MAAATYGSIDVMKILLSEGALVDTQDKVCLFLCEQFP